MVLYRMGPFTVSICLLLIALQETTCVVAFNLPSSANHICFHLSMGLYDNPLPPRRPPTKSKGNNNKKDMDEDEEGEDEIPVDSSSVRLFSFDPNTGKEVNEYLPALGRKLTSGVDCYFEASDRLVRNLVGKTGVHVDDACWALEACKGDLTEAWMSISTARRLRLNSDRLSQAGKVVGSFSDRYNDDEEEDWDEESYEVEMQQEYEKLKSNRLANEKKREMKDFLKGGEKDADWLPIKNPKPLDDEPWFTG